MTETLCDSGMVKLKAGANHTELTAAQYTSLINQAEGALVMDTRVNWLDIYSTMDDDYKKVIEGAVSAKAAAGAINYDIFKQGSLSAATTMINVLLDEYDRAVSKLKESNVYKPFGGTAITE